MADPWGKVPLWSSPIITHVLAHEPIKQSAQSGLEWLRVKEYIFWDLLFSFSPSSFIISFVFADIIYENPFLLWFHFNPSDFIRLRTFAGKSQLIMLPVTSPCEYTTESSSQWENEWCLIDCLCSEVTVQSGLFNLTRPNEWDTLTNGSVTSIYGRGFVMRLE